MNVKVKDLLKFIANNDVSMEAEVWIEYPERYGLAQPVTMMEHFGDEDQDMIQAMTIGADRNKFYIFHHF